MTAHSRRILIVASDPMLAALVGAALELAPLHVAFPESGERVVDALARLRPVAAVVLDADGPDSESDVLLARARKAGVLLFFFGSSQQLTARLRNTDIPQFALPHELEQLVQAVHSAVLPAVPARQSGRRGGQPKSDDPAELLSFKDASGTRWSVYDRRADRRRMIDRRFVSERGEVRHCDISETEAQLTSAGALTEQLARAVVDQV